MLPLYFVVKQEFVCHLFRPLYLYGITTNFEEANAWFEECCGNREWGVQLLQYDTSYQWNSGLPFIFFFHSLYAEDGDEEHPGVRVVREYSHIGPEHDV